MDSLTQIALGGAVGYAVMGRKVGKKAALYGAAFGTLPDLDVFISYDGPIEDFTYHRSATHSLLIHLFVTPVLAWLMTLIHPATKIHFKSWSWMIFAVLSTHAFLDSATVYGTQLLWPLTEHPFSFSSLFIIDPLYTLPLLIGWIIALAASSTSSFSHLSVRYGLIVSSVYLLWSFIAKWHIDALNYRAFESAGIQPEVYVSTPAPFTTLLWRSVAIDDGQYYEVFTSIFDQSNEVTFDRYTQNDELLNDISNEWDVQRLKWFTKGAYGVKQEGNDILISDIRMGIEQSYVFTFKVASILEGKAQPVPVEQLPRRPELDDMPLIWQRITDPSIALTPEARSGL